MFLLLLTNYKLLSIINKFIVKFINRMNPPVSSVIALNIIDNMVSKQFKIFKSKKLFNLCVLDIRGRRTTTSNWLKTNIIKIYWWFTFLKERRMKM